jgi:hypothetical protein
VRSRDTIESRHPDVRHDPSGASASAASQRLTVLNGSHHLALLKQVSEERRIVPVIVRQQYRVRPMIDSPSS